MKDYKNVIRKSTLLTIKYLDGQGDVSQSSMLSAVMETWVNLMI